MKKIIERILLVFEVMCFGEGDYNQVITKTHVVKEGETIFSICCDYHGDGKRVRELKEINNLDNADIIFVGQTLIIEQFKYKIKDDPNIFQHFVNEKTKTLKKD